MLGQCHNITTFQKRLALRLWTWPQGHDLGAMTLTSAFYLALAQLSDVLLPSKILFLSVRHIWPQGRDLNPRVATLTLGPWPWTLTSPWHSSVTFYCDQKYYFWSSSHLTLRSWPWPQGRDLWPQGHDLDLGVMTLTFDLALAQLVKPKHTYLLHTSSAGILNYLKFSVLKLKAEIW